MCILTCYRFVQIIYMEQKRNVEDELDCESDILALCACVHNVVDSWGVVRAFISVLLSTLAFPVCLSHVVDGAQIARKTFQKSYFAIVKACRIQTRAIAKVSLKC